MSGARLAAYRSLALTILGLDVVTLGAELQRRRLARRVRPVRMHAPAHRTSPHRRLRRSRARWR